MNVDGSVLHVHSLLRAECTPVGEYKASEGSERAFDSWSAEAADPCACGFCMQYRKERNQLNCVPSALDVD